jgi:hypothetical protein
MDNAMHGIWRNRRDINGALSSFMGRRDFFGKKVIYLESPRSMGARLSTCWPALSSLCRAIVSQAL